MTTTTLHELLDTHIAAGSMPGAVALVARDERVEVVSAGTAGLAGSAPMRRDSLFRIASITKPIVAAAAMTLVDDGLIAPPTRSRPGCPSWPRPWSSGPRRARSTTWCRPSARSPSWTC